MLIHDLLLQQFSPSLAVIRNPGSYDDVERSDVILFTAYSEMALAPPRQHRRSFLYSPFTIPCF
jgi:hypothetical protein